MSMKWTRHSGILLLLLSAILAAPPVMAEENAWHTLRVGEAVPELNFSLLDGTPGPTRADLQGKVTVLDFWATWCVPCIEAFPRLEKLASRFEKEGVEFYSITYEPPSMARPFLAKKGFDVRACTDDDFTTFKAFRAWGIPTVYIIDRKGTIASVVHPEDLDESVIQSVIDGRIPKVAQSRGWSDGEGAEEYFRSLVQEAQN